MQKQSWTLKGGSPVRIVAVTFYTTDPDIHSRVERGLVSLELDHLALALLLSSQLEVLGSLDGNLVKEKGEDK